LKNNKHIGLLVLLFFTIVSCSKHEKVFNKLDGAWTLTSYRFKNQQGLSYYPEASGSLFFENCSDTICAYSMNIQYNHPQISGSRVEAGKFGFDVFENKLLLTPIVGGIDQTTITNGVTLLTKTDLEFQYTDDLGRSHHYIFEK
jgi:hypothetical protein